MRRRWILLGLWAIATALAVAGGVLAVRVVGATISHRGPLGDPVIRDGAVGTQSIPAAALDAPAVRDTVSGEWGSFVVECRDTWAIGIRARPERSAGWRVVSWENGPDDEVDAVFSDGRNSVSLDVYCNRGRPTVDELEHNTLGDHPR